MYAIIGGTGLARLAGLEGQRRQVERTPYGDPSAPLTFGRLAGVPLVFLARHGHGHTIAPHEVNYRANLWALKQAGAQAVISVATVAGIRADLAPGALAIPDQLIDYTFGRASTYFEAGEQRVEHIDFAEPYDGPLRDRLVAAAADTGIAVLAEGTYGCTEGPRLETAAEIRRLERDGCDLVGMTNMPEAALARELGLAYAAIAVVWERAAGKRGPGPVDHAAVAQVIDEAMGRVRQVLVAAVSAPA